MSKLVEAIEKANIATAKKALDAGENPNKDPEYGSLLTRIGLNIWNSREGLPREDTPTTTKLRAIAELLIERGAKLDFASAAMLNKTEFVAAALAKDPKLAKSKFKVNDHTVKDMAAWCGAKDTLRLLKGQKLPPPEPIAPEPLVAAIEAELLRFAKNHKKLSITKLALDLNAAEGDMFLAIDTSSNASWRPGSFTHSQFAELHEREDLEPFRTHRDLLTVAAKAIAQVGAARKIDVLAIDHDETEDAARKRMKAALRK